MTIATPAGARCIARPAADPGRWSTSTHVTDSRASAPRLPAMAEAFLVVLSETSGEMAHVIPGALTVGRGAGVDLSLADPEVSRRHASIRVEGTTVVVEDLGSANGTRVNGEPIDTATRVESGGLIDLGKTRLQVRMETGEAGISTPVTPTEIHRPRGLD